MPVRLTDDEIAQLIAVRKPVSSDLASWAKLRSKRGHDERDFTVTADDGSEFRVYLRQSRYNRLDFSVILAYRIPGSTEWFRLRRYNGRHGEHSNKIEGGAPFYAYHVHTATERYQELGMDEDGYAEPTDRFSDLQSALQCMLQECGFEVPKVTQRGLFDEELQ